MNEKAKKLKITIFDMQPISPQIGGGRIRLAGLYHNLGTHFDTTYIGSYDWRGEKYRDQKTYKNLREICVPLSKEHFDLNDNVSEHSGINCIDLLFNKFAYLSQKYIQIARKLAFESDILVFSHPWVFPLVEDFINPDKKLIIYDAQNIEGLLRYEIHQDKITDRTDDIIKNVIKIEYELSCVSDVILSCSHEDIHYFNKFYNTPYNKLKYIQNGVFSSNIENTNSCKPTTKLRALFIGSSYQPNIEAAEFIINTLSKELTNYTFVIAGGVCNAFENANIKNIEFFGCFSEDKKNELLNSVNLAINPMFSGSGTNIKMFDFMAANLPIITTPTGGRGIINQSINGMIVAEKEEFANALKNFDPNQNYNIRSLVLNNFSFETISLKLGEYIENIISPKKNILILSTWNNFCGIADYSRQLANEFNNNGYNIHILANENENLYASYMINDISSVNVHKVWHYDDKQYINSQIDIYKIKQILIQSHGPLIIQYHPAFYSAEQLIELLDEVKPICKKILITAHNTKSIKAELYKYIANENIHIIFHNAADATDIEMYNISNYSIFHLGVPNIHFTENIIKSDAKTFRIGGFGFMRKHKGILKILEALNDLKNDHDINFEYLGLHATNQSPESLEHYTHCKNYIEKNNLDKNVTIDSDFHTLEYILSHLDSCDIIILPYNQSYEGFSASASTAFAAEIPVCVTDCHIFKDIIDYCYKIKNNETNEINEIKICILELMKNKKTYSNYAYLSKTYKNMYSIEKTSQSYLKLIKL